ncbi:MULTISPECIES: NmrA/HSCARG family protein [Prochlorococcus]|uniref:NADPH-dependent reductase n=1 Tax=Prochlorococcus marinus (strain SARG / CCMP1375 / SS120) TaxID=167539 RepID=Q7VCS8_PROMA|nr:MULTISPECIES: NmrA/HSCARG family protein [Prochlorococcus]AAP99706.1 NADPH-dependent reductase [Prochlorococcus marinus subsp. marinus str. CCMP1375]KGG13398.1 NADPH-dependent reductase [Prochlorococcus marinus str. LG]KGG21358.1 NADPH-dependent reductase [Prochlorococcus marinus str. SS2]KGG24310.1 NADPH-dependent reductase [Prochlorococcus marinus str. SS35]KGG33594.1 NADPH-dependent reductase [Prochlorococcus marinus str. SS51]
MDCRFHSDALYKIQSPPKNTFEEQRTKPVIAVTMATSRQGVSVVNHLSKSNLFSIRAITRDPLSQGSKQLAKLPNVQVLEGDLLEPQSLEKCFAGVYGVFGNTTPTKGWALGRGSIVREYELQQGRNLVDVLKRTIEEGSLKHFVFSSVCKAKDPLKSDPAPSHFSNKWSIEEYIFVNGLKEFSTILRPVSYFENFDSDLPSVKISEKSFPGVVKGDKVWQTIAVDDIGLWANAIFKKPRKFLGQALNLAGAELTGNEMAEAWQKVQGYDSQSVRYSMVPRTLMNFIEHDIAQMASWIERAGYGANLQELHELADELGITMTSFTSWLNKKAILRNSLRNSHYIDLHKILGMAN